MILVTGGTGFLGSELLKQLTDKGLEAIPNEMWDMLEKMTRSAKGS